MSHSSRQKTAPLLFFLFLALTGWLLFRFGESWLRHLLLYLSTAVWARNLFSDLPPARRLASRFVAGEDAASAMAVTRELNAKGMHVTLDYLGESITNPAEAISARDEILNLLELIDQQSLDANVSVKLSQLGLKIDEQLAFDNVRRLVEAAAQRGNKIRIDMEESSTVDVTLKIYRTLRDEYCFDNVGVVIQAYLYRSEADVRQLVAEGAWVRLCKGAYAEPEDVAFPLKADTDRNYIKLMRLLLSQEARQNGVYLGVATHDEKMIQATIDYVNEQGISAQEFEFQMLYGVRRELQESLVRKGYQLRIYVPYGTAWYPYLVRRLAERPANLWFFVTNLVRK